jgi:hypothetical protein
MLIEHFSDIFKVKQGKKSARMRKMLARKAVRFYADFFPNSIYQMNMVFFN